MCWGAFCGDPVAQEEARIRLGQLPGLQRRRTGCERQVEPPPQRVAAVAGVPVGGEQGRETLANEVRAGLLGLGTVVAEERADIDL